ncbi:MAG: sigma-70 family RNA polymerase sigma factor [Alkalilacustris sp.]
MTDETLSRHLQDIARQDRAAFRALYRQSAPRLAGVLGRMLRDRTEVEDALQDVFVRVWQRAAQYDPARGAAMGWLVAIARSVALDRLRARPEARGQVRVEPAQGGPGGDPLDRLAAGGPDAEGRVVAQSEARRVVDCFDELEADRLAAVRGAYLEGLSYDALAQRHAVPLNTMRTWLRRSLLRLKECLER